MTRIVILAGLLCVEAGCSLASLSSEVTGDALAVLAANCLGMIPAIDRCGAAIFDLLNRGFHDVA